MNARDDSRPPHKLPYAWAVSYTHLDVYKRQSANSTMKTKVLRQPACTASAPPSIGASAGTVHNAPFR